MKDAIVIKVKDVGEAKSINIETDLSVTGIDCILIVEALMQALHMPFNMTEPEDLAVFGAMLKALKHNSHQEAVEAPLNLFDELMNLSGRGSDE